jgi:hypothetical protein
MHADDAIHELGDAEINADAGKHVGLVGSEIFVGHKEVDGLAHRDLGRLGEIIVQAPVAHAMSRTDRCVTYVGNVRSA